MRLSFSLLLVTCTALLLTACTPTPKAEQEALATTEPALAPAASAATATPAQETFGVGNFAGVFNGTLPCADCPGIDTTLTLKADGSYLLHSVYQDRNSSFDEHGVWQVEQSDRSVRLQQEGKDTTSSAYQILSKDEIKMLDSEGKPIDTPLNYSLHRKPA